MKKVNIYLDDHLWEAFRIRCLQEHISASQQIGLLMAEYLRAAERQKDKAAEARESP